MFLDAPSAFKIGENLDQPTKQEIARRLYSVTRNTNAVSPIKCRGEGCSYLGTCPFTVCEKYPIGSQCPVEQQLILSKLNDYTTRFSIDRHNPADMSVISRLVEIELLEYRLRITVASKYPDVLVQETIGVNPMDGTKITKLAASPVFHVRKKLTEEKMLLLKELVGTRKEKYKEKAALKQTVDSDYSSHIAEMNKRLRELLEVGVSSKQGSSEEEDVN